MHVFPFCELIFISGFHNPEEVVEQGPKEQQASQGTLQQGNQHTFKHG